MSIIDYFRRKSVDEKENLILEEEQKQEKFVSDLSFVELQKTDWKSFAGVLKDNGVLSASYDKSPISVEYSIARDNSPMVELTFKSNTSDSIRKVQLYRDRAYLYVNGAIEAFPETQRNKDLGAIWENFQNRIRYNNMIDTNREGFFHSRRGTRLILEAQKMINMQDVYDREQEFLEKNKDVKFDGFCYSAIFEKDETGRFNYAGELPKFVPLIEKEDGYFVDGEPVIPFTPRTLEYCILHMTKGQKIEDGEYLDGFEEKCRKLQKYSCFESEDWDKVIEFGKDVVRRQYQVSLVEGMSK